VIQVQINIEVSGNNTSVSVNNLLREDANPKEAKLAMAIFTFTTKMLTTAAKKSGFDKVITIGEDDVDIEKFVKNHHNTQNEGAE